MMGLIATGDMAKPGSTNRSSKFRPADDHYPTPLEAVYPLVRHLALPRRIWEPACGEGHIARVLEEYGYHVEATNLVDRGYGTTGIDFLQTRKALASCIVTNAPFSLDEEFIEHALHLGVDLAVFFLPLKKLAGAGRYRRINGPTPPCLVLAFIERIRFFAGDTPEEEQPGWNTEDFAWFVWRKGFRGKPTVDWLSRDDGLQSDLFRPCLTVAEAAQ
jgi:hypothetical protein